MRPFNKRQFCYKSRYKSNQIQIKILNKKTNSLKKSLNRWRIVDNKILTSWNNKKKSKQIMKMKYKSFKNSYK